MYRREECLVQASICREKAEYLSPVLSGNVFLTHQIATSHTCANANRGFFSRLVRAKQKRGRCGGRDSICRFGPVSSEFCFFIRDSRQKIAHRVCSCFISAFETAMMRACSFIGAKGGSCGEASQQ
jgi:hypothetical protein